MVGHSPHCDQAWISTIVGIRLPLYPRLRIRLMGEFPTELIRSVITGELNLALLTAPSLNTGITAVSFAHTPLAAGAAWGAGRLLRRVIRHNGSSRETSMFSNLCCSVREVTGE